MREQPLLSILIPSIPSRFSLAQALVKKLEDQIGDLPVEVCVFTDNKRRSIGLKRDALVQIASGKMLSFCDDDDDISPEYCPEMVAAIRSNHDVDTVVFTQHACIDGKNFSVRFGLEYKVPEQARLLWNGQFKNITRPPWTVCAWKSSLAKKHSFPDTGMDEDWQWIQKLLPEAKTQARIEKVLHTYRFNSATSEGEQTIKARQIAAEKAGTNVQPT